MRRKQLSVPGFFSPEKVGAVWRVSYQEIAAEARRWARESRLQPAVEDDCRIGLLLVDVQNTFCIPDFELYVGGRSGMGAVDDNRRLCTFIYKNLAFLTRIIITMDTHQAMQIFHSIFLINEQGEHPDAYTLITEADIQAGKWHFNPALAGSLNISPEYGQRHLAYYTSQLQQSGKYELTIWPYHAMLGGIGHALVSAVEEAIFFHTIARYSQPVFFIKGNAPLTEHYSALSPEVEMGPEGEPLTEGRRLLESFQEFDRIIIAGQAKSHCVAWTISDLLENLQKNGQISADKFYLLEDCTSPVVIPGVIDYSEQADAAFQRFAAAGVHLVKSSDPIASWPGMADSLEKEG